MTRTTSNDERIEQLSEAGTEIAGQLQVLVNALDELREEVQWANRNVADPLHSRFARFRLTSMPLDPTAEDWQLNQVDESTVEQLRNELSPPDKSGTSQTSLF